jgi:regulator of sigma E protease
MLFVTILVFAALLMALVLAHELGHFIMARKAGCKVEEFAFGFPPKIISFTRNGTRFCFNALPIGGYVKIEGEDMDEENPSESSFGSKSAGWRILILASGVLMNVLLAALLLSVQAGVGVPTAVTSENAANVFNIKTYIVDIDDGSPASEAGFQPLDRIVRIVDTESPGITSVQQIVSESSGQEMSIEVEREGAHLSLSVIPRINPPEDQGALGVVLQEVGLERVVWWKTPVAGVERTWNMLTTILTQFGIILKRLVVEGTAGGVITGPVGIAIYTNEATSLGLSYVLDFAALISLNLAIINILPFPALDGGRILFVILEVIFRRRVPAKIESITHMTGFVLLIALLIFITFKDVGRFF